MRKNRHTSVKKRAVSILEVKAKDLQLIFFSLLPNELKRGIKSGGKGEKNPLEKGRRTVCVCVRGFVCLCAPLKKKKSNSPLLEDLRTIPTRFPSSRRLIRQGFSLPSEAQTFVVESILPPFYLFFPSPALFPSLLFSLK